MLEVFIGTYVTIAGVWIVFLFMATIEGHGGDDDDGQVAWFWKWTGMALIWPIALTVYLVKNISQGIWSAFGSL